MFWTATLNRDGAPWENRGDGGATNIRPVDLTARETCLGSMQNDMTVEYGAKLASRLVATGPAR